MSLPTPRLERRWFSAVQSFRWRVRVAIRGRMLVGEWKSSEAMARLELGQMVERFAAENGRSSE